MITMKVVVPVRAKLRYMQRPGHATHLYTQYSQILLQKL